MKKSELKALIREVIEETIGMSSDLETLKKWIQSNPEIEKKIMDSMLDQYPPREREAMKQFLTLDFWLQSAFENFGGYSGNVDPLERIRKVKQMIMNLK